MTTEPKPRIGITSTFADAGAPRELQGSHTLWDAYTHAVLASGGIPVILPSMADYGCYEEYLEILDGLILAGGQDIMPSNYGQEPQAGFELTWQMEPKRDAFEIALLRLALERDMPVLGICRGVQLMAAALGGSLHQDVGMAPGNGQPRIRHFQVSPWGLPSHSVGLELSSKLASIIAIHSPASSSCIPAATLRVNSLHHQAVDVPPEGFLVSATAPDGIIEAMESTQHSFVVGVQWHPERMFEADKSSRLLFEALVEASRQRV
jgi:putative glutamine amidotransferase